MRAHHLLLCVTAVGCMPEEGSDRVAVEQNELGVSSLQIERGTWEGTHRLLVIHGFDVTGQEVATLTSRDRLQPYYWKPGMALLMGPVQWQVDISVRGLTFSTRGAHPRSDPAPDSGAIFQFAEMKEVGALLKKEVGLQYTKRVRREAFTAGNCSGSRFPNDMGSPYQCCEDGNETWHKVNGGPNNLQVGHRVYDNPCSNGGSDYNCGTDSNGGFIRCLYGPAGGRTESLPVSTWDFNEDGVYHPNSPDDGQCGRSNGEGYYIPWPPTDNWYSGVEATNGGRACCNGGIVVSDPHQCISSPPPVPEPTCVSAGSYGCDSAPCCDEGTTCQDGTCMYLI